MRAGIIIAAILLAANICLAKEDRQDINAAAFLESVNNIPGLVFKENERLLFRAKGPVENMSWALFNWNQTKIGEGKVSADGTMEIPTVGRGYYYITLSAPGGNFINTRPFSVVCDPDKPRPGQKYPYSIDGICAAVNRMDLLPILRMTGAKIIRDRVVWEESEAGVIDEANIKKYEAFSKAGLELSLVWHTVPRWMANDTLLPKTPDQSYRISKELAGRLKGTVAALEFWNEPGGFSNAAPWELVSHGKAAYLGAKAGNPDCIALNCSMLGDAPGFSEDLYMNDAGYNGYFDVFNLHLYTGGLRNSYLKTIDGYRKVLEECGNQNIPVWITECGMCNGGWGTIPVKGKNPGITKRFCFQQELVQAEFTVKAAVSLQAIGEIRPFVFAFAPYNEGSGDHQRYWGMVRYDDNSAMPAVPAFSAMTDMLGAAEYEGAFPAGNDLTAYLYRQPDGSQTMICWSKAESERNLELPVKNLADPALPENMYVTELKIPFFGKVDAYDLFGRKIGNFSSDQSGKIMIPCNRFPMYVTGLKNLPAQKTFRKFPPKDFTQIYDRSIVYFLLDSKGCKVAGDRRAVEISNRDQAEIKLAVYNFSDVAKTIIPNEKQNAVTFSPESVTVPPQGSAVLNVHIKSAAPGVIDLVFGGTCGAKKVTTLRLPTIAIDKLGEQQFHPIESILNPDHWVKNTTGDMDIERKGKELVIKTHFDEKVWDKWLYPRCMLKLPRESFAGCDYLYFEVKNSLDMADASSTVFFLKLDNLGGTGRTVWTGYNYKKDQWVPNVVDIRGFDRDLIAFEVGFNPKKAGDYTLSLRNIKLLKAK